MKVIVSFATVVFICLSAVTAQPWPRAKVTVRVIDENNRPMANADVQITFDQPTYKPGRWGSSEVLTRSGKTDTEGLFFADERSGNYVNSLAKSPGYYSAHGKPIEFWKSVDGKWEPWNLMVELLLKKITNPIPMYARRLQMEIPVLDQPVTFDLVESDWMAPYGKGKIADLVFILHRRFASRRDYESVVSLTFSNPGDGLRSIETPAQYGSELKLPHTAPENGYAPEITTTIAATPGGPGREDARGNRNYLFRVRSVLDENKRPVSGLYGKIDGDIRLDSINSKTCLLLFTYYLNPTPSDRNVEFDPKRNLFTNLKPDERVTAP